MEAATRPLLRKCGLPRPTHTRKTYHPLRAKLLLRISDIVSAVDDLVLTNHGATADAGFLD